MSGIKYLLDTNFILGLLKSAPEVMSLVGDHQLMASQCAYSSITRMELLGFPDITIDEQQLIENCLADLTHLAVTTSVENQAIDLRRSRKVKLPDAIIAATALVHELELLTLDAALHSLVTR